MIFLGWRSTPAFVDPIFRNEGFRLFRIGSSIPTSLQSRTRASSAIPAIPFQASPTPDVIFRKNSKRQFLPIECKTSSFGPLTEQAKQAASLLTCTGTRIAEVLGAPNPKTWSSTLLYAVGGASTIQMEKTLSNLAKRLGSVNVDTTTYGVMGIRIEPDGVYLHTNQSSAIPLTALKSGPPGIRIMKLEKGEDPRPLYLIPLDSSCRIDEDYQRRALEERVRIGLASLIGSQLNRKEFGFDVDDLMRATIEVWTVWGEQNAKDFVKNAVRNYARGVFRYLRKLGIFIEVYQERITFKNISPAIATQIRNYLSSAAFRRGEIDLVSQSVQMDFSSLSEGW